MYTFHIPMFLRRVQIALLIITNTIKIQNVNITNDYYVVRMENMTINKFYKVLIFFIA